MKTNRANNVKIICIFEGMRGEWVSVGREGQGVEGDGVGMFCCNCFRDQCITAVFGESVVRHCAS